MRVNDDRELIEAATVAINAIKAIAETISKMDTDRLLDIVKKRLEEEDWTLKPGETLVYDGDGIYHAWKKSKKVSTFYEPWIYEPEKGADDE